MSGVVLQWCGGSFTSRALDITLPGQLSIPQLWRHFHTYLSQTPSDINLRATNGDLVGFFNSVPQHRLIDAVHSLIQHWQTQHTTHTLTVDTKATGNPYRLSHIGRHHARHPTHHPHTADITTIVAVALNTSGLATTLTNRYAALGLAPSCHQPYATSPSP